DNGTLAPAAAVASVIFTPAESLASAEAFASQYPSSYGLYGFVTGINPSQNWQSSDALGIDLGQMMLNIENARDGAPWSWMMGQPRVFAALQRAGFHQSREGTLTTRALQVVGK
ncbi:MAG: glucoamylase family protein, partial [Armatimonadota bacterium]